MFEFSPGEVAYLNTPLGEALFSGLLRHERKKTSSFDKASIASFESILIKVPEDIVSLFNELIFADPALRWPILDSLRRSKKKSMQFLKIIDKFSNRQIDNCHLQNRKIQETISNLNKFFLLEKYSEISFLKASHQADSGNIMYLPLVAHGDFCPLFSLITPTNHKRRAMICSNWFEQSMFFNIYHFFNGAYPVVNNAVYNKLLNHLKISRMQISDMGALLGSGSDEEIQNFNSESCKNFLLCLQKSNDNALMIYPQERAPKGFARWIVEGIIRDPNLVIKPLVIYIDDKEPPVLKHDISLFESFFDSNLKSKPRMHIYENHIPPELLKELISSHIDLEQKDILKDKVQISPELYAALNKQLEDSYAHGIEQITKSISEKTESQNILYEPHQILSSKLKHNPDLSVTKFIKEICEAKSIKTIKKMDSYEVLKGLGIDLDILFKYYSF